MPNRYEIPVDATDWIASVEATAAQCRPGDTLVVHSFAQEKLAEQVLARLGLEGQVTLVSTGKRMRVFVADAKTSSARELAQRIFDHLKETQARANRTRPARPDDEAPGSG